MKWVVRVRKACRNFGPREDKTGPTERMETQKESDVWSRMAANNSIVILRYIINQEYCPWLDDRIGSGKSSQSQAMSTRYSIT